MLREKLVGLGGKGYAGAGGDIVEKDGQLHPVGYVGVVLNEAGLGRFVVVGGDEQQASAPESWACWER